MDRKRHFPYMYTILALCVVSSSSYALEEISEEEMSNATGQSVALTLENFSLVTRDDDTSYINLIPRGEISATALAAGQDRADIFIRNLSITRNDATTTRASNTNIESWGSGYNPFLFRVSSINAPTYTAASNPLAFFQFESPNYCPAGIGNTADCPSGADEVQDAYNLRLGLMLDLLIKSNADTEGYGADVGTGLAANEGLSTQMIWNAMSINGTRLAFFQTPGDSANPDYNNAFGMRGLLRFNTNANETNNGLRLTSTLDSGYNGTTNRLFNTHEGLRISDLDVNLPIGAPNYQSLIFGRSDNSGNFFLEVTRIPDNPAAYNAAYIDYNNPLDIAAKTCTNTTCGSVAVPATHGTIRTGDVTFTSPTGDSVNVGSNNIEGMFINHAKLTTTGL